MKMGYKGVYISRKCFPGSNHTNPFGVFEQGTFTPNNTGLPVLISSVKLAENLLINMT